MYAYCNNNPVNYYDPTGENAVNLLVSWLTGAGTAALAEPTPFGEVVVVLGAAVIAGIWLGETIADGFLTISNALENVDDTAKSVEGTGNTPSKDKDDRLKGEPGEVKKEGNKETHIGPDGRADKERHWTNHGHGKYHSIPHDHNVSWNDNGKPNFGPPQNYWDGSIPIFP